MIAEHDAEIWARLLDADSTEIDEQAANGLLRMKFRPQDVDRMNALAEKARQGTLSEQERQEIESYNRVGHLMAILQARAKQVLHRRRSA
jgi:hypothetical protein